MGTATFFEETTRTPKKCYFSTDVPKPLKFFAKTQKALQMKRVFITPKNSMNEEECTDSEKVGNVSEVGEAMEDEAE